MVQVPLILSMGFRFLHKIFYIKTTDLLELHFMFLLHRYPHSKEQVEIKVIITLFISEELGQRIDSTTTRSCYKYFPITMH